MKSVRLVALALVFFAPSLHAVEIVGKVTNGTTGQPVADQTVNLIALRGQMVPVRETVTAADGSFRFVIAANPNERFLVQVPFRGVNYNQPAISAGNERISADVQVFDPGARPDDVTLRGHVIFLEPHPGRLRISEFFSLRNHSQPPRTYAPDTGSFRFALPAGAGDLQVSAGRAGGMPLRQQPQPAEAANSYSLSHPIYPGDAEIQISYALPMPGATLDLRLPLAPGAEQRHLAVPAAGVEVEGTGLKELPQSQVLQARLYSVEGPARAELALHLKVDPAALQTTEETAPAGAPPAESAVRIVPHPVNGAQWYIVGLSLFVLLLGLYYLHSLVAPPSATHAAAPRSQRAAR